MQTKNLFNITNEEIRDCGEKNFIENNAQNNQKVECNICQESFYNIYTMIFHQAVLHDKFDNVCLKCFGVFMRIDNHKKKCQYPFIGNLTTKEIHQKILRKKYCLDKKEKIKEEKKEKNKEKNKEKKLKIMNYINRLDLEDKKIILNNLLGKKRHLENNLENNFNNDNMRNENIVNLDEIEMQSFNLFSNNDLDQMKLNDQNKDIMKDKQNFGYEEKNINIVSQNCFSFVDKSVKKFQNLEKKDFAIFINNIKNKTQIKTDNFIETSVFKNKKQSENSNLSSTIIIQKF